MKPLFIIGEARGVEEERLNSSFVGTSGAELLRMLNEAGVITLTPADRENIHRWYTFREPKSVEAIWHAHRKELYRTNVFQLHPPGNDIGWFCGTKEQAIEGYPPLVKSRYVRREFAPELERLCQEILSIDPNLIVCSGNTALWALTGRTAITKSRGYIALSTHTVSGFKILPTFHPAAVMRQYQHRPTVIADLMKAANEARTSDIKRPEREIWIEPSIEDIERFNLLHILGCRLLSVDIETFGTRITCIGFAPTSRSALVIPFDDERQPGGSYWTSSTDERQCWNIVRRILEDSSIPKLFQNGLYDISFLWRGYGIKVMGAEHDTMLLSHTLHPQALKGLEYLGSVYSDERSWKGMKKHPKTIKGGN